MRWVDPCAGGRGDSVPQYVVHAAVQHGMTIATILPNPGNTPAFAYFTGPRTAAVTGRQQSIFHQLLQIVTASRSGCVRLTYRILAQLWQKKEVCTSNVQCSDRTAAVLSATNRQHLALEAGCSQTGAKRNDKCAAWTVGSAQAFTVRKHQDRLGSS